MEATLNLKLSELTIDFIENLKKTFGANSSVVLNVETSSNSEKGYNTDFIEKMKKAEDQYKSGTYTSFGSMAELEQYVNSKSSAKIDEVSA